VAVAEEGSFTQAAEKRRHTAQPSLNRQISDLEAEVCTRLIDRGTRGMSLTPAGREFLDYAREVEVARESAQRGARLARALFTVGFPTGYELE
jgi:LysR family transcriptional regulator, hca operon transcriptional activator